MTDQGPHDPREGLGWEETEPHRVVYVEPPIEETRRRTDPWTLVLGILGGVLLGTGVTFGLLGAVGVFEEPTPPTIPPAPTLTAPPPTGPPPSLGDVVTASAVAERTIPSTVFIQTSSLLRGGSGSGVVYGDDGYIVTNHHVVDGAGDIAVVFADGAVFPAELVGTDPITDLAVLLVERTDVTPIEIGSSAYLSIGEPAIAVGNPLGLQGGPTVTSGIVSALDRRLDVTAGEPLFGLVQTDAPIAPGSSGGALVDARARLIGITTAIAVSDVGAEGLGFAIPIDMVVGVVTDLIEDGEVSHGRLGITGETAYADQDGAQYPVGVEVRTTTPGSAYEQSGGQVNDVIVAVDESPVRTIEALLAILRHHRAEDTVEVRILRGSNEMVLDVELGLLTS